MRGLNYTVVVASTPSRTEPQVEYKARKQTDDHTDSRAHTHSTTFLIASVTSSVSNGWPTGGQCINSTGVILGGVLRVLSFSSFDACRFASDREA